MGIMNNSIAVGVQCPVGNTDVGVSNPVAPKVVTAITLEPAAVDCTVQLLHGTTGVVAWELLAKANTNSVTLSFPAGLNFHVGVRVTVAGAGAKACIAVI